MVQREHEVFSSDRVSYVLIMLTLVRNSIWKDDNMLWSDTTKKSPSRTRAHSELAVSAIQAGEYKTAIDTLTMATGLAFIFRKLIPISALLMSD